MTKLTTVTEEAQLTDSQGWLYRGDEHAPLTTVPQIMDILYSTELGEELDWEECLKLAVYADNVMAYGEDLTNDRLAELWEECQEEFQGDFSTEAEFAEDFFTSTGQLDEEATKWLVIDWQGTYNYSLQFDYWNAYIYARNNETNAIEVFRFFFRSN
jgi:hypothetical protein